MKVGDRVRVVNYGHSMVTNDPNEMQRMRQNRPEDILADHKIAMVYDSEPGLVGEEATIVKTNGFEYALEFDFGRKSWFVEPQLELIEDEHIELYTRQEDIDRIIETSRQAPGVMEFDDGDEILRIGWHGLTLTVLPIDSGDSEQIGTAKLEHNPTNLEKYFMRDEKLNSIESIAEREKRKQEIRDNFHIYDSFSDYVKGSPRDPDSNTETWTNTQTADPLARILLNSEYGEFMIWLSIIDDAKWIIKSSKGHSIAELKILLSVSVGDDTIHMDKSMSIVYLEKEGRIALQNCYTCDVIPAEDLPVELRDRMRKSFREPIKAEQ